MTTPPSSFQAFYAAAWSRLVGQVYPLTGDLAAAEDAVQEAMVRAADRWDRIQRYELPEAWVRLVAMRLASNGLRRVRRQAALLARLGPPAPVQPFEPEDRALVDALAKLPRKYREVLVLHHLADLPVDQVARHLGMPSGTVKGRLVEGRRRLALLLGDDEQQPVHGAKEEPDDARSRP
ncbi:MAG TPA: SigE family RNA polymerase sigma factor [Actinomycetota bacterium]|jgi:RNA polymerase sigma-70 factor (ECF subfamily)|nr:SigE family RNA polymerase sigma factor [Actinomycetota bacterium]